MPLMILSHSFILLLEGLIFLLDEVGSGVSVRSIDDQRTQDVNVELCHSLRIGERHGNQLRHYHLHTCILCTHIIHTQL